MLHSWPVWSSTSTVKYLIFLFTITSLDILKEVNWQKYHIEAPHKSTKKRCPFHHRGLECKSRKSWDTWSNRQIWPWVQNEAGQRLTEFCQENTLVTANTLFQQHKRRLYTWTSPDGQYWNQIDYILSAKDGEALHNQQKLDWELTVLRSWTPYCQIKT